MILKNLDQKHAASVNPALPSSNSYIPLFGPHEDITCTWPILSNQGGISFPTPKRKSDECPGGQELLTPFHTQARNKREDLLQTPPHSTSH